MHVFVAADCTTQAETVAHTTTATPKDKLKFIYLCNDILLQSRKKGPEYNTEFREVLEEALGDVYMYVLIMNTYACRS